jgi:hypothetical protein
MSPCFNPRPSFMCRQSTTTISPASLNVGSIDGPASWVCCAREARVRVCVWGLMFNLRGKRRNGYVCHAPQSRPPHTRAGSTAWPRT